MDMATVQSNLVAMLGLMAVLFVVAALVVAAWNQFQDMQGGALSQKALIGFIMAAAFCVLAIGFLGANPLTNFVK